MKLALLIAAGLVFLDVLDDILLVLVGGWAIQKWRKRKRRRLAMAH
jgi:high-affinity nickel permease